MAEVLEIVEGPNAGRSFDLTGRAVIGRDASADIQVADDEVSRRHAELSARGDGTCEIRDLGSRNGTHVNGQQVTGTRSVSAGDEVRVGTTVLELRADSLGAVSAVRSAPQVTQLDADVLRPADQAELSSPDPGRPPGLRAQEGRPGYIDAGLTGEEPGKAPVAPPAVAPAQQAAAAGANEDRLTAWIDTRVKQQTNTAAIAFLAVAALVVAIYFGVT